MNKKTEKKRQQLSSRQIQLKVVRDGQAPPGNRGGSRTTYHLSAISSTMPSKIPINAHPFPGTVSPIPLPSQHGQNGWGDYLAMMNPRPLRSPRLMRCAFSNAWSLVHTCRQRARDQFSIKGPPISSAGDDAANVEMSNDSVGDVFISPWPSSIHPRH